MRFMIIRKADQDAEADAMPSEQLFADMMRYNETMVKTAIMLAGEGLQRSAKGACVISSNGKTTIVDGPFTETKELIAGLDDDSRRLAPGSDRLNQAMVSKRCQRQRRARAAPGPRGRGLWRRVHRRDARGRGAPVRRDRPARRRRAELMTVDPARGTPQ